MAGRKRIPEHLKLVSGTFRPDRTVNAGIEADVSLPAAPDWLSARATEIFDQIGGLLISMRLMTAGDGFMLSMLASRIEEVELCSGIIEDLGRTYPVTTQSGDVMQRQRPEVGFERGVKRQGGMPPEFRKDDHHLQRLRVDELCGLVFGTFSEAVPDLETYLGPVVVGGIRRVLTRPTTIIGRSTQILPNNWKLYFENVKDTYHASILHSFLTTFRINRLSMPGSINIDESGGNHFSQAKLDYAAEDADYQAAQLRSDTDLKLQDNSVVASIDEYGDSVSVQILTVFPGMVLQQIRNTIAVRVLRPRGVDKSELEWVHLGFVDDDEAMTERRLRQGNLVGPAGYIALEDGCVGGFVQRALQYNDDDSGVVMMGGHEAESQTFRASEAAIRGFWKKYRALTGT